MPYSFEELMGVSPLLKLEQIVKDQEEILRRSIFKERMDLYRDDSKHYIDKAIESLGTDPNVAAELRRYSELSGGSQSLFRRLVDEVSRPVYAVAPYRRIKDGNEEGYAELLKECNFNAKMDMACRVANACNHCLGYVRYVPSLERVVVDIIPPDSCTVVSHPDDPLTAIAVIYWRRVYGKTYYVFWDGKIKFQVDEDFHVVPFAFGESASPIEHGLRRMPFFWVHRHERSGNFWDTSTGKSNVSAHVLCSVLRACSSRLLKIQGFHQPCILDPSCGASLPKNQTLDMQSPIVLGGEMSISWGPLASAAHFIELEDSVKFEAAANMGISRARLNQTGAEDADDVGLAEQRAESIKVMLVAEQDAFDVLKMVSQEHVDPSKRIPDGASLGMDFGELEHRVDRATQLKNRQTERSMGLRSVVDDLREDNPEITSDEEAMLMLDKHTAEESVFIEKRRALNQSPDNDMNEPGQDPRVNGAMGPAVRDGKMSKDEAASKAKSGSIEEWARNVAMEID